MKKLHTIYWSLLGLLILSNSNITVYTQEEPFVEKNVLLGKIPTSNAQTKIISGDSTVPQVQIVNAQGATDSDYSSQEDDSQSTKIIAGIETGGPDNGFSQWQDVYLQYDLEKSFPLKKLTIYRNTYANAISEFKNVKIEVSNTPNFQHSTVVFNNDIVETNDSKGTPQVLVFDKPISARYIRLWGKGHYIKNTTSS